MTLYLPPRYASPSSHDDRPLALDLFCGPGGVSAGLVAAGWRVLGVDVAPQPHYPYPFLQRDALTTLWTVARDDWWFGDRPVSAVVASPPCFDWSVTAHVRVAAHGSAHLLPDTLAALAEVCDPAGVPWVVENVEGADMGGPATTLCGSMFDGCPVVDCADGVRRRVRRHRRFRASFDLPAPRLCDHRYPSLGVHGGGPKARSPRAVEGRAGYQGTAEERRQGMGTPWMTRAECNLAIPPAYAEWVGRHLMRAIGAGPGATRVHRAIV